LFKDIVETELINPLKIEACKVEENSWQSLEKQILEKFDRGVKTVRI
jgi:hypothetical protein